MVMIFIFDSVTLKPAIVQPGVCVLDAESPKKKKCIVEGVTERGRELLFSLSNRKLL